MTKPQPPILTTILDVQKHPNADTLDIVKILGFQSVVKEGQYKVGNEVLYFEPDTAFSLDIAKRFNIDAYLSLRTDIYGEKVLVIKEVKLRGELSEGLLLPPTVLDDSNPESFPCFKFEVQAKSIRTEDAAPEVLAFPQYGSLENLRKVPNFFEPDEYVVVTEKIHGTNSRVGFYTSENGEIVLLAGSRTLTRKAPEEGQHSLYWHPYFGGWVEAFFKDMFVQGVKSAVIYGELFGPNIQSYSYGLINKEIGYRAFTLKLDGVVQAPNAALDLLKSYNIETVPVIYQGQYSYELIQKLAERPTMLADEAFTQHSAEGVVIQGGGRIAKYVSTNFLLGKAGKNKLGDI
jgi:tRNA-binding EMAP/Myf-like protein